MLLCAQPSYLYKVKLVQAGPGKLLELIDLYKAKMPGYAAANDEAPLWIRHSQGDQWDLMIIAPMGSYREYYSPDRMAKRERNEQDRRGESRKISESIAWQEDLFVYGPSLKDLRERFAASSFFHVEMFVSLTGRQADLYKERGMENEYLKTLKRPENFIFVRDQGASWDLFTLGTYRDLKHYAESANISEADQEAAAKAAGFEGAKFIGPYLRTLINRHHDTLAGAVK
jgi:hypothetical protein